MNKWGLVVAKKEMTKMWIDDKFMPVTLVKVLSQEIVRYKTEEKDGYDAMVVWVEKKELNKEKGNKISYKAMMEFAVDGEIMQNNQIWNQVNSEILNGATVVDVIGTTKGKGFQGVMKRFNTKGGPHTHGSKFHRQVWSLGNRKPRRVQKGHPHAGHMWNERMTLKNRNILDVISQNGEELLILKGSLPGSYNGLLKLVIV